MYSPKIREDLIPLLYQIKQVQQKPMTQLIDELLRPQVLKWHQQLFQGEKKGRETCSKRGGD